MRLISLALAALLVLIQFPLWLGKGGWLHVRDMQAQVAAVHQKNDALRARNAKLDSEVRDLNQGTGAVEERARLELGMIKQDEVFIQVVAPSTGQPGLPAAAPAAPAAPTLAAQPAPVRPGATMAPASLASPSPANQPANAR